MANVDLRTSFEVKVRGGYRAATAGDVNGDGLDDLAVARGDNGKAPTRGRTWVVFSPFRGHVDLRDPDDWAGFLVDGESYRAYASRPAGVGDVNGDGLSDVAVGSSGACEGDQCEGAVYVVFGKKDEDPIDLHDVRKGQGGYVIYGGAGEVGEDVTEAGDVNQDGLGDILIGSPFGGAFYLLFGKRDTNPVELSTFDLDAQGMAGYRISAPTAQRSDYYSVANTGDVNGDGVPDAALGVIRKNSAPGTVYVVYGKTDPLPVDLDHPELYGYQIKGDGSGATTGYAVSPAGDVNDDGLADTLIGAPWINCCDGGEAYVVFGKRTPEPVMLKQLAGLGQRIKGPRDFENMGTALSLLDDVNSDGVQDFAIGAPFASRRGRSTSGSVYVVFGRRDAGTIRVDDPKAGFRIDGARGRTCGKYQVCAGDLAGSSLAVGDLDDDAGQDLALGAPAAGKLPYSKNGRVFVVRLK